MFGEFLRFQVSALKLKCGPASMDAVDQSRPSAIFETPSSKSLDAAWDQQCPAGQVAVGVHGRTGTRLDALGLICAPPRIDTSRPPPKALGRVHSGTPLPAASTDICTTARTARARNSPAAPGLEARCRAINARPPEIREPVKVLGRMDPTGPAPSTLSICEAAELARARNNPSAAGLEARCRAVQAQQEPPLDADQVADPEPVAAPEEPGPEPGEPLPEVAPGAPGQQAFVLAGGKA
jgi:hypothetical protein